MKPQISSNLLKAIDDIANGLAKQRQRSVYEDSNGNQFCRYRGDDNCMCAIGIIMPDEAYDPYLEGSTALDLRYKERTSDALDNWMENLEGEGGSINLAATLQRIQRFHDVKDGEQAHYEVEEGGVTYSMLLIARKDHPDEALAADIKAELLRRAAAVYEVPAQ